MTIEAPPLWLQGGTYPARLDRFLIAQLYDEGVMGPLDCKVSQRGAGANFTVDVAVGEFVIQGDDQALQGNYMGRVTATENKTVTAAPGSNSRYDLVTMRMDDPNAGGNTGNIAEVIIVQGTASASPAVPALPASSLPLAVIGPIATATASITNSLIHDFWTGTGPAFATSCRLVAGPKAPVGELRLFSVKADVVNGWLYCNGQAVSRSTYADLFAMIATSYGVGNGSTTFNVPDLRERIPLPLGTTFGTLGVTGGEVTHVLTSAEMPVHLHAVTDPGHNHAVTDPGHYHVSDVASIVAGAGVNTSGAGALHQTSTVTDTKTTGLTVNTASSNVTTQNAGSSSAHNNMQPYQVVSGWAIRT